MIAAARVPLVLASSSPRRLALLRQVGVIPDKIEAPEIDETPLPGELPRAYARRMAAAKALAVRERLGGANAIVLAADTVVACGRRILPKAADAREAARCLDLLSGRRHRVYGGVAVARGTDELVSRVVMTMVELKRLSLDERTAYLASGEWEGKAGGYAIQGRAGALIPTINGSYSNVVGLPLAEVLQMLTGLGWRPAKAGP